MTRDSNNTGSPDTLILRRLQRTSPKVQTDSTFHEFCASWRTGLVF